MRLKHYLTEIKINKVEINYSPTPDKDLGLYIRTILSPVEGKGLGSKALIKLIKKYDKNKRITFSTPISKGGKALIQSLIRKDILKLEKDIFGSYSDNSFIINRKAL